MPKHPGGRPKKKLDYEIVSKLASIQCTEEEIASVLDVSVRTLQRDREFCRVYKKSLEAGRISVRRAQFKKALAGDTSMLIWLGKQLLGQKDQRKEEVDLTQPINLVVDETDMKA